jgi:dethiobiotin synthetase
MSRAFFITGTDTAIGKTRVATALLKAAREQGLQVLGLKPVAAGCEDHGGIQANEDAWRLMQGSSGNPAYADVNPMALREAMAPHIAAQREGRRIEVARLVAHCQPLIKAAEFTVIEGAGGWDVPLNDAESMADLAAGLGCPVILVVGLKLGCLNHALLTARSIQAHGLQLAGWVANRVDPAMVVAEENIATLEKRIPAPLLGTLAWDENPDSTKVSAALNIGPLLE